MDVLFVSVLVEFEFLCLSHFFGVYVYAHMLYKDFYSTN